MKGIARHHTRRVAAILLIAALGGLLVTLSDRVYFVTDRYRVTLNGRPYPGGLRVLANLRGGLLLLPANGPYVHWLRITNDRSDAKVMQSNRQIWRSVAINVCGLSGVDEVCMSHDAGKAEVGHPRFVRSARSISFNVACAPDDSCAYRDADLTVAW